MRNHLDLEKQKWSDRSARQAEVGGCQESGRRPGVHSDPPPRRPGLSRGVLSRPGIWGMEKCDGLLDPELGGLSGQRDGSTIGVRKLNWESIREG